MNKFRDIDKRLIDDFGEIEMTENFNRILKMLSKTNFLFPDTKSVFSYPDALYNYHGNGNLTFNIGDVVVDDVIESTTDGVDYKIKIKGNAEKLSNVCRRDLFGSESSTQTHGCVILIEIPTDDYTRVKYKNSNVEEDDLIYYPGRACLCLAIGVYDNNGSVGCATTSFNITCDQYSRTFEFDFSELNLKA